MGRRVYDTRAVMPDMKPLKIRFETDPSIDDIEVVFRAQERDASVEALMKMLEAAQTDTLTVFDDKGKITEVDKKEIISLSADRKLVNVVTEDGHYFTRQSLQSLHEEMNPYRFVRISRYEIVNLAKVIRYDFTISGTLRLELAGGMETWASRRSIPEIRRRLAGKR